MDDVVLLLELAVEGVLRAVDVERGRQIALRQPRGVHIADAEAAVEGVNHACGGGVRGKGIQRIRHIAAVQRQAGHVLVVVHEELASLNAASGKAHHSDSVRVNAVYVRVFADEADGTGDIQRTFLLCVGRQAIIHDEGLEAQLAQRRRRGQGIRVIAAELVRAARHQHHSALGPNTRAHRNRRDIGAEIPLIEVAGHVLREAGFGGHIAFFPQIQHLNLRRVSRRVQHSRVSLRRGEMAQHVCTGIPANRAGTVVII